VTTVNSGDGNDIINVLAINAALTVNAGAGDDTINVGNSVQKVSSINAVLTVNGGLGTDTLNVVNTVDSTASKGNLTSTQLTGLGMASGISYSGIETLAIGLGSGADTFTIASTMVGTTTKLNSNGGADNVTVLTTSSVTTVNTGDGNDIVNIQAISAALTVNTSTGNDTINVGSLAPGVKVNKLRALLTVNGQGGKVSLIVDNSGDTSNSIGKLTSTQITGLGMASGITYSGLSALEIDLNSIANSNFTVSSVPVGTTTIVRRTSKP
jgi:Ca2+-binding RTX toxin-like protein